MNKNPDTTKTASARWQDCRSAAEIARQSAATGEGNAPRDWKEDFKAASQEKGRQRLRAEKAEAQRDELQRQLEQASQELVAANSMLLSYVPPDIYTARVKDLKSERDELLAALKATIGICKASDLYDHRNVIENAYAAITKAEQH